MPHAAESESQSTGKPPREASSQPAEAAPKPGTRGALFRALAAAGVGGMVAYNAEAETQSMVTEAVGAQVQPILVEMRQLFAGQGERISGLEGAVTAHSERISGLEGAVADQGRQIATLQDAVAEHGRQIAALQDAVAEQGRQIASLTAVVTGHDEKLNVLVELVTRHDEKLDALRRELRLIWGALGVLVTLLTVVFGFLFRG